MYSPFYKEYNKTMGKVVKSCGKYSLYRVYIKRVYKDKKGAGKSVLIFVYRVIYNRER